MAAVAGRESYLSEVEVIFTRLPPGRLAAPPTPTSEIPLPVLADAMRLALRTADWEEDEEEETETMPRRAAYATEIEITEPMIDIDLIVEDTSGSTVPLEPRTLQHAFQMAATMRADKAAKRLSPVAPRVQPPVPRASNYLAPRTPAPVPVAPGSGITSGILLAVTFFLAAAAALAGALYL